MRSCRITYSGASLLGVMRNEISKILKMNLNCLKEYWIRYKKENINAVSCWTPFLASRIIRTDSWQSFQAKTNSCRYGMDRTESIGLRTITGVLRASTYLRATCDREVALPFIGSLRIDYFRTTTPLARAHVIVPRRRPVEIWIYDSAKTTTFVRGRQNFPAVSEVCLSFHQEGYSNQNA